MGTLTACVKKVDLSPAHKAEVFARTRRHRADGLTPSEAAKRAVRDLISEIRAGQASAARKAAADAQARAEDAERAALMAEFDVENLPRLKDEELPLAIASLDEAAAAAYLGIAPEELQRERPVSQDEPGRAGAGEAPAADAGGQAQPAAAVGGEAATDGTAAGLTAAEGETPPQVADAMPAAGGSLGSDAPGEVLGRSNDGPTVGVGIEDLRRMVARVSAGWRGDGPVVDVVATVKDLPAPIVDALRSKNTLGSTRGLRLPNGQIYLVADKLDSMAEAQAVLFHEVYGHEGLRAFLGDEYVTTMALLRTANPKLRGEAEAWFRDNGQDEIAARVARGRSQKEAEAIVRALAVEEALADRAGGNPPPNAWKTLMSRLQAALRKLGMGWIADRLEAMTEAETHAVLMGARRSIDKPQGELPGWLQDGFVRSTDPNTPTDTEREFRDTERAYGGREAHASALAAGRTRLPYSQWVQVRTPAFKAWFGDWQAVRAQLRLDAMDPLQVRVPDDWRGLSHAALRGKMAEALDRMVRAKTEIEHPELGVIHVGRVGAKKSEGAARDPAKSLIAADIEALIPASIYARSEPSRGSDGRDIDGYSTLLARVRVDDAPLIAAFTVRHQSDGRWYYNAVALHDANEKAPDSYGQPDRAGGSSHAPIEGLAEFVRRPLVRVNPDTVSKATDPDTGEPRVMFHGTASDDIMQFLPHEGGDAPNTHRSMKLVDAFRKLKAANGRMGYMNFRSGSFFSPDPNYAGRYTSERGGAMYPVYIKAENPVYMDQSTGEVSGVDPNKTPDALIMRDGNVINEVAVIDPTQIKSAIGNRGSFDPEEASILLSRKHPPVPSPTKPLSSIPTGWRDPANRLQFAPGAWLYSAMGRATGPLLDKLGMRAASPELRRQLRQMKLDVQKAQDVAAEVARASQGLTTDERLMVSDIIEKELATGIVPPSHAVRLAGLMSQAMTVQSRELVRLGMLSEEAATRWDGAYLPRFYESKLRKQVSDAWADAMRSMFGRTSAMKGVQGKHLKGRGIYETIAEGELPSYQALGWEVRDPDFMAGQSSPDGTVQIWRDYTREEREKMGEIRDAGFRFVMGYMQTQRDIALGRMFEKMANDPASSSRTAREGWLRVPDGTVEGTGAKRYGKLAGRYVPRAMLSHLTQIDEAQSSAWQMYRRAMAVWKMGKTALNPVSHMNNVLSNLTMAHFGGVSYHRGDKYLAALKDFATGSKDLRDARDAGLFLGTMSDAELMNTLPPELKELAVKADSKTLRTAKFVFDAMTFFLRKPMGAAYQAEDTFFRYLLYKEARSRGMEPDDAIDWAQRYIFAYDDLPKGARMVRDFGIPFFAYTYKAIPTLLYTALAHPDRFAAPAAVMWAANAAAYAIANADDDDDWWTALQRYLKDEALRAKVKEAEKLEREHLPPWMKGSTAMLTPKAIRLGMDEVTKLPVFLDVARIVPGGDLFDVSPNAGGLPIPQPFTPSHPLLTIATAMIGNRDLWTGKDLVDKNDSRGEAAEKRAGWMWKQITPAAAIGNYHFERLMNALAQASGGEIKWLPDVIAEDYTGVGRDGLPAQPKHAVMQTFGIKARPLDLERSQEIAEGMQKKMIREIDAELRQIKRLNDLGAISDKVYDKREAKAEIKKERLEEGLTVDGDARD